MAQQRLQNSGLGEMMIHYKGIKEVLFPDLLDQAQMGRLRNNEIN